jgi:hypothetical protein
MLDGARARARVVAVELVPVRLAIVVLTLRVDLAQLDDGKTREQLCEEELVLDGRSNNESRAAPACGVTQEMTPELHGGGRGRGRNSARRWRMDPRTGDDRRNSA